jgi:hypothetical protein
MKTYYMHNNAVLRNGDTVDGKKVRIVERYQFLYLDGGYVSIFSAHHHGITHLQIPRCVAFHPESGIRIEEGETLADGSRFCGNRNAAVVTSNGLVTPLSKAARDAGIEIRVNPTPDEYLNGLPRNDDGTVTGIHGRRIPAGESVWTGRCYRHADEFAPTVTGRLVLRSRVPARWVTGTDGSVGEEHQYVRLDDGRFAPPYECVIVGGVWRLLSDCTPVIDEHGRRCWLAGDADLSEYTRLSDGRYVHESRVGICAYSREICVRSEMRRLCDGSRVSQAVFDERARGCCDCGEYYIGIGCPSCAAGSRARIRYYNDDRANFLHPEKDVPIKFGIELEVGCDKGFSRVNCATLLADAFDEAAGSATDYCVFKNDGSLTDCDGFEIVTRPDCPSVHKRIFGSVLRDDRVRERMSSFDSGLCGMHIHVSRAPLSQLWIGRMMLFINDPRMSAVVRAAASRSANRYTTIDPYKKLTSKSDNRYEALNTTGTHTIEFRIFRGTLDPDSFVRNIEFVESCLEFARPATRSLSDIGDPSKYLSFISHRRKDYPRVFDLMKGKELMP